jgi:hypothetical protein
MKNMGGFSRLSVSFAYASGVIFCIGVGLMAGGFVYFLGGVLFPEDAIRSKQLISVMWGFVGDFLLTIKLYIYGFLLMAFFAWLAWIFAGFAKNE